MARIELSNIGGGGGTTLSLTTTGTSGASTLAGSVLNIPVYQGQLTLTTTGTSGAATLSGDVLNIPQYSGGGTPAGSAGQVQFNSTPAGSFAASANLAWDNSNVRLNVGAPPTPTARLNVRGGGTTSATATQVWTNSGNTELMRLRDDGFLGVGTSSPSALLAIEGNITGSGTIPLLITRSGVSSTDASFMILNGTNNAGQLFPQFALTSNFVSAGANLGGSFSGRITNSTPDDIGIIFEARAKGAIAMSQGWLMSFRGLTTDYVRISHNGNTVLQSGGTFTDNGYRLDIISASSTHGARVRAPNANSGTNALLVQNTTVSDLYKIEANGKISYWATNTAAGTTGAQTINRPSGTVNFGIGAGSLVVTNSLCTTSSIVFATVRTNDATAYIKNVVPAAGSFTINLGANATAETSVGFFIIN